MRSILRVLWLSILETIIIVITLIALIRLNLPMSGLYITYMVTAIVIPLVLLLLYNWIFGRETLIILPISMIIQALYSLAVSLFSDFGQSSFSSMFKGLMYFLYFLPSVIYCVIGWVIFAIIVKVSKNSRRQLL